MSNNMIQFNDWIKRFDRPIFEVTTVRGKIQKKEKRRGLPSKPGKSPLFLNCETKVLNEPLTYIWSNLTYLEKSWSEQILLHGRQILELVSRAYLLRWQILERFAKVTSERLTQCRKIDGVDSKIKKRQISVETLTKALQIRDKGLGDSSTQEIVQIIGQDQLVTWFCALKSSNASYFGMDATEFIKYRLIEEYNKNGITKEANSQLRVDTRNDGPFAASHRMAELIGQIEGLERQILKFDGILGNEVLTGSWGKAWHTREELVKIIHSHEKNLRELVKLSEVAKAVVPFPLTSSHVTLSFEQWLKGQENLRKSVGILWFHIICELREQRLSGGIDENFIKELLANAKLWRDSPPFKA
jgi:hypothetical protein